MGVDMAAAARTAVGAVGPVVDRMSLAAAGTRLAATGTVGAGIMLVLAGTGVTGTPVAGMVGVVAGIMVTAAAGELAPRLVSVLALDYSEER
jgi:hypothetical protein